MKKEMKDVTFDEFSEWANRRACDGQCRSNIRNYESLIILYNIYRKLRKGF